MTDAGISWIKGSFCALLVIIHPDDKPAFVCLLVLSFKLQSNLQNGQGFRPNRAPIHTQSGEQVPVHGEIPSPRWNWARGLRSRSCQATWVFALVFDWIIQVSETLRLLQRRFAKNKRHVVPPTVLRKLPYNDLLILSQRSRCREVQLCHKSHNPAKYPESI